MRLCLPVSPGFISTYFRRYGLNLKYEKLVEGKQIAIGRNFAWLYGRLWVLLFYWLYKRHVFYQF